MENIAKSTSYGCYLDCDFETAKYPDDKTHIVGLLAEYVYDLEQRILHYDERYIKLWNEIETLRECVSKEFDQDQQITDLQKQLAVTKKALELACEEITGSCEYCSYKTMIECPVEADCLDEKINHFKTKAKEMLENE